MNKGMPHIKDDKPGTPIMIDMVEAEKWLIDQRVQKEAPKSSRKTLEAQS